MYVGRFISSITVIVRIRMDVRIKAEIQMDPKEVCEARWNDAWIVCVDIWDPKDGKTKADRGSLNIVGGGANSESRSKSIGWEGASTSSIPLSAHSTPKYHPPTTPAPTTLRIPLATPQLHNQTLKPSNIPIWAIHLICHSHPPPPPPPPVPPAVPPFTRSQTPTNNNLPTITPNGTLPTNAPNRITGEVASKNGFSFRIDVVNPSIASV